MNRLGLVLAGAIALVCCSAAGGAGATLSPAGSPADPEAGLQPARLGVTNDTSRTVEAVEVRWKRGGPAIRMQVTIAPEGNAEVEVPLPAIWLEQEMSVRLLDADGEMVQATEATITWPADAIQPRGFLDARAVGQFEFDRARWPRALRRHVLWILAAMAAGLAGCLLLPGGSVVRASGVVVIVAAGLAASAWLIRQPSLVLDRSFVYQPGQPIRLANQADEANLRVLTARRRSVWRSSETQWLPVYPHIAAMQDEDMVIRPGRQILIPIGVDEVVVLRKR